MLLCSVPLIYLGWKVFWAVPSWYVVRDAKALQQPPCMGTWYGMDLARGIPQHRMGRAETTLIRSLLQFCQWLYTSGLSSSELSGLCCNQDPDTHSTAYQSLKEKSGMRIYCGSEATSHRIAHVTELLHYGPAFPQAQHHGLDGSQAHMSGSEQRIQSGFWENLLRFCCTGCSTNSHQQLCRPCSVPGWCPCRERWHPHLFPGFCPAPHLQAHPEHQTSRALTPLLPLTDFLLATHACNSRQS